MVHSVIEDKLTILDRSPLKFPIGISTKKINSQAVSNNYSNWIYHIIHYEITSTLL
jgi:hypothetical protein